MDPVASPFPHPAHRGLLAVALSIAFALPFVLDASGHPTPRERFRSVPSAGGDFASIEHFILDESGDIDVLVLGTSYLWAAVDTPFLEEALTRRLKRPVVARTLGSNFRGEEMYFTLLSEVVKRRQVRLLVLSMPGPRDRRDSPHPYAHRIAGSDLSSMYSELSLRQRAAGMGLRLLGAPRHALALLRPERGGTSPLVATKGALLARAGFLGAPFHQRFEDPPQLADLVGGRSPNSHFCFGNDPLSDIQQHFTRKTLELARMHGIRVIALNVPTWNDRIDGPTNEAEAWPGCAAERMNFPQAFPEMTLVGASPRALYGHLTREQAESMFYSGHMNSNGARYFTGAVLYPALVDLLP